MDAGPKNRAQQNLEQRLGVALVNRGDISQRELDEAISNQVLMGGHLATCLWEMGIERIEKLAEYSSTALRIKQVPMKVAKKANPKVLNIFKKQFVSMHRIIPLGVKNKELSIATSEPWNLAAVDDAAFHSGFKIKQFFLTEVQLTKLMEEHYDIPMPGRFQLAPTLRDDRKPYVPESKETAAPAPVATGAAHNRLKIGSAGKVVPEIEKTAPEKPPVKRKRIEIIEKVRAPRPRVEEEKPILEEAPVVEDVPVIEEAHILEEIAAEELSAEEISTEHSVDEWDDELLLEEDEFEDITSSDEDIAQIGAAFLSAGELDEPIRDLEPIVDIQEAYALLDVATNRDELGEILVRVALSKGSRALLLTRATDVWTGWIGAGPGIQSEYVKALMFHSEPGTCFGLVGSTGAQFLGPLQQHPTHDRLLSSLGGHKPNSVGLFPVQYRGKVVFGIYMDGGDGGYINPDIADILLLALRVPSAVERIIHEKQAKSVKSV